MWSMRDVARMSAPPAYFRTKKTKASIRKRWDRLTEGIPKEFFHAKLAELHARVGKAKSPFYYLTAIYLSWQKESSEWWRAHGPTRTPVAQRTTLLPEIKDVLAAWERRPS